MTWFKVDDKLHSHKKAAKATTHAMGLWVLAGSWCADQLTDGFIPDYMAEKIDRDYEELAARLVAAGLWVPAERDGDKGWQFHEWNDEGRQPTREQVLAERAAGAGRQKRARERAKEKRERESHQDSGDDSHDRNGVSNGVTDAVTNADVTPVVTVPPTRPVPSYTEPPTEVLPAADAAADRPAIAGMPLPPKRAYNPADRAFAIARWRIEVREAAGAPIIGGGRKGPLHALKNVVVDALAADYTDEEVRAALSAIENGIPSKQQLERELVRFRNRDPNDQGRAGAALSRRPVVSAADQRVADGEILYAKYAALDAAEAAAKAGGR